MEAQSNIYTRAKAYVQAAIELLAGRVQRAEPERLLGLNEWVRTSESTFAVREIAVPYWHKAVRYHADALHALAEFQSLVEAIKADPLVARYFGVLAGTILVQRSFSIDEIADHLI